MQPGKGGSLVFVAGPSFMPAAYRDTPLAPLLPFRLDRVQQPDAATLSEGYVVQPTDLGMATPAMQIGDTPEESQKIWQGLAPLYWLLRMPEVKPGVRVLAEHPTQTGSDGRHLPVFCIEYVGAGKVLFHATDETWRWRFRIGDRYFARYWGQMLRYLCRTKLEDAKAPVMLTSDRRTYDHGESVALRVRFGDERIAPTADDGVTVVVEVAGRQIDRLQLHRTRLGAGSSKEQWTTWHRATIARGLPRRHRRGPCQPPSFALPCRRARRSTFAWTRPSCGERPSRPVAAITISTVPTDCLPICLRVASL